MMYSKMKFGTRVIFLSANPFISVIPEFGEARILKFSKISEVIVISMPFCLKVASVMTSLMVPSSSPACTATLRSFGEVKDLSSTVNPCFSKKPSSFARMIGIADSAGNTPIVNV